MRFLDPLLLTGLGLMTLPIIIHLIHRKRATRRPFPAIEFLLRSRKRLAKRLKVKQLLLLLLRILVFLLLPLAMARPYLLSDRGVTASERLPTAVVFVLDDSFSMGHATDGTSAFDRAKQQLLDRLDELRPWDQAALVLARDPVSAPIGELVEDHGRVRDVVRALDGPSALATDLPAALEMAAEIHALGDLPVRRTVLLTDDTASSWEASAPNPEVLARLGEIEILEARSGTDLGNVAIAQMGFEESRTSGEGDYDVWVRLENFGESARVGVRVDLEIDDVLVGTTLVDMFAGAVETVRFTVSLGSGLSRAHAIIHPPGPDIEADNHRYLTLHLDREVRVLLVNGDPRTVRYRDEMFYLERALFTGPGDASGIQPTVVGAEELDEPFDPYDVVVLANVASMPRGRVAELVHFVRGGGGLLFTMGNRVDALHYNDLFGELLPKRMRSVRELCDPDDPDASLLATRIARADALHPVFRVFDLPGGESLQSVTVYSYMLLEPSPVGSADTLISYGDGGPALVEREFGAGRVALFTTSIDRDWTDLPIRTAYLPLMRRVVRYLARRGTSETDEKALVGQRVRIDVEAQNPQRVSIVDPTGDRFALAPEPPNAGFVYFTPAHPGPYDVSLDIAGETRRFAELMFAANLDTRESDLRPTPASTLALLEGPDESTEPETAVIDIPERRLSLWPPLLLVVLLLLYVESGMAARRRMWVRISERLQSRFGRRGRERA